MHIYKQNLDVESIDIPSMASMPSTEYGEYINPNLLWVDHHDVLRVSNTGCPLAVTQEQVDQLIAWLESIKAGMVPEKVALESDRLLKEKQDGQQDGQP